MTCCSKYTSSGNVTGDLKLFNDVMIYRDVSRCARKLGLPPCETTYLGSKSDRAKMYWWREASLHNVCCSSIWTRIVHQCFARRHDERRHNDARNLPSNRGQSERRLFYRPMYYSL